jgi:hypothetical protein
MLAFAKDCALKRARLARRFPRGVLDVLLIFSHFELTSGIIGAVAVRERGEDNDTLLPTRLDSQC